MLFQPSYRMVGVGGGDGFMLALSWIALILQSLLLIIIGQSLKIEKALFNNVEIHSCPKIVLFQAYHCKNNQQLVVLNSMLLLGEFYSSSTVQCQTGNVPFQGCSFLLVDGGAGGCGWVYRRSHTSCIHFSRNFRAPGERAREKVDQSVKFTF